MNIDKLIASVGFKKLKKDCVLHGMLRLYSEKKSELASCDASTARMLTKQLEEYSDALKRLLKHVKCFPDSCEDCEGLTKCIDCIIRDNCVEAQLMFQKLMHQTVTT